MRSRVYIFDHHEDCSHPIQRMLSEAFERDWEQMLTTDLLTPIQKRHLEAQAAKTCLKWDGDGKSIEHW